MWSDIRDYFTFGVFIIIGLLAVFHDVKHVFSIPTPVKPVRKKFQGSAATWVN